MHFDAIEAATASLIVPGVEVLEPRELRDEICRIAKATLATYA